MEKMAMANELMVYEARVNGIPLSSMKRAAAAMKRQCRGMSRATADKLLERVRNTGPVHEILRTAIEDCVTVRPGLDGYLDRVARMRKEQGE